MAEKKEGIKLQRPIEIPAVTAPGGVEAEPSEKSREQPSTAEQVGADHAEPVGQAVHSSVVEDVATSSADKSQLVQQIESVLEEDLDGLYSELSEPEKVAFKHKGETVSVQIKDLLAATHVKIKQIFKLIVSWLQLLPRVNTSFIKQEAKIKTDKLLRLRKPPNS